jgi:hypothetical protein
VGCGIDSYRASNNPRNPGDSDISEHVSLVKSLSNGLPDGGATEVALAQTITNQSQQ